MKEKLLKCVYLRYRSYFYTFFEEEFLYSMPKEVREPAMSFLSQGKDKLERWAYFMAKFLQHRLVTDPDKIKMYEGMMLMLKLLLVHIESYKKESITIGHPEEEKDKPADPVSEVEAALTGFRKLSTPDSSVN